MPKVNGLTPKQRRFVEEYMVDCNATDAARRAGYKQPNMAGPRLMVNDGVRSEVDRRQAQRSEETGYTQDRIAAMLQETYDQACRLDQTSAAVQASMGLAKLHGLIVDKHHHSGNPLAGLYERAVRKPANGKANGSAKQ